MGTVIRTLCYLLFPLFLALPASGTIIKTGYVIDDGQGFWDKSDPRIGQSGNPGKTLGEQRRNAHEFGTRLAERIVWIANNRPLIQYTLVTDDLGSAAIARTDGGTYVQRAGDVDRGYHYPTPIACLEEGRCLESWEDWEPDDTFMRVPKALRGGNRFTIPGRVNIEYSSGPKTLSIPGGTFVGVTVHEYLHHFGITSGLGNSSGVSLYQGALSEPVTWLTKYDQFVRRHGAEPRDASAMTLEQLDLIQTPEQDIRFAGPLTVVAAPQLLSGGFDQDVSSDYYGEVFLHTPEGVNTRACGGGIMSHLAGSVTQKSDDRTVIMSACGGTRINVNIIAYMLADIGWGPVIDSTIAVIGEQDSATIEVAVQEALDGFDKAVADNLLVTIDMPDGVLVESASTAPADCDLGAAPFTCRFASLDSAASIALTLGGVPGVHAIMVDVDHQAPHVDPEPVNNFASALITVGENTITSTTLDDNAVPENEAADTKVGAFVVTSTGGAAVSHSFALVDGSGSNHNACFKIDGEDLLTTKEFDYEAQSSLNIRVQTLASNGFTQATAFTVAVTDVGGASAWVPSLVQPVYAGDASPETAQHATLAAALLLLGLILLAARQRRMVVRYGALVLLGATLLVACGGGGGGDSGPAPTPPPPVATFSCS